jgi:acetyl-CoA carboxylase beta subunit
MNYNKDELSPEEAYFYKLNKELLEKRRKENDVQSATADFKTKNPHWMRCPKCGNALQEIEMSKIKVDKCIECEGVFFDNGELKILLESKEPAGFLSSLKKLF